VRSKNWQPERIDQRVRDILDAIVKIDAYVGEISREQFLDGDMHRDAVARQILIIAEASDKIFALERMQGIEGERSLARRCPDIPWREIRDMGVLVRHIYGREDPEEFWSVATEGELRDLRTALIAGYPELDLGDES
jgi:uncharacterized protein with HEPN domain